MRRRFGTTILQHRLLLSAFLLGITIVLGWFATHIQFDNTIETYFLEKDLAAYRHFLDQFGSDEIVVIAFGDENVFSPANLRLIDVLSQELKQLPHVRRVLSLTTAKLVYGEGNTVHFDKLVPSAPLPVEDLAPIRQRALADPIIPNTLVSQDGRSTAIVAEIDHLIGEFDYKVELLGRIRALLQHQEKRTGKRFYLGGGAVLDDAIFRYTQSDQRFFFPLMVLVIILVIFSIFRTISLTLLPLAVVVLAAIWTYGLLVLLGFKINVISTVIGPLLMAVAIADSIHVVADYLHEAAGGERDHTACIVHSFERLLVPCFLTSLTTILGLLSLLSADLSPIRQFGLVAACGVMFAFVITLILVPILLSVFPFPAQRRRERITTGVVSRCLLTLGQWHKKRAVAVLVGVLVAAVPAVMLLGKLTVGTNSLDYLRNDDEVRLQMQWIDSHIGGTTSLEFLIDAGHPEALKTPALLQKMERFQTYLKGIEGITGVYSLVDLIRSLNRAYRGGDPKQLVIPASAAAVAQQLLLLEGSADLKELVSVDYAIGRITARVEIAKSQSLAHQLPAIEARMHQIFTGTSVTPTGMVFLMSQMERYLLSSQIKSFLVAFGVITLVMMFALRSWQLGMLAMVPNLLPILMTLGLMPLLGIALDVGTVMIAGVALGLVVDDTIHLLTRVQAELQTGKGVRAALAAAMEGVGRPITYTSIVLCLGFLVLVFASFNPVIHFGILSTVVIALALGFDLIVVPASLGFFEQDRGERKG